MGQLLAKPETYMIAELAQQLWQARLDGTLVDVTNQEQPKNVDDAYAIQNEITRLAASKTIGFKVGATSLATQDALGLSDAIFGPVFEQHYHANNSEIGCHAAQKVLLESEVIVTLGADLPPRAEPYTVDNAIAATAWIAPGFEIVAPRFNIPPSDNGNLVIADSGLNLAVVVGPKTTDFGNIDLTQNPVTLFLNNEEAATGHSGLTVFIHPIGTVAWLANQPRLGDRGLRAGDMIATGTCTGLSGVAAGVTARADFGVLGEVSARFFAI